MMENVTVMQKLHDGMKYVSFKRAVVNILTAFVGFIILLLWIKALHDLCPLVNP
jgi:hypothetical protein